MTGTTTRDTLRAALDRLPRVQLADLPTPLHDCPRFSEALGGKVRILIKRDDLTGLAFGGNKTRKFDFVLGEARAQGATAVVTGAASQSNHARQAAAAGATVVYVHTGGLPALFAYAPEIVKHGKFNQNIVKG